MSQLPGEGGAAWLPDPTGRFDQRYWDGSTWTTAVMRGGQVVSDSEALPEGPPGSAVAPPAVPPIPPAPSGLNHVPAAGPADRYTSLSPDEAQRRLGQMLSMQGWSVSVHGPGRFDLSVSVPGDANTLIGLLLLLLWIVPGLIYFWLKSRPTVEQASMTFVATDTGTRIAISGSKVALERLSPVMLMLPW